jgi:hypothetical protein
MPSTARLRRFLVHEFRMVMPPTVFFFIGFNLILFTTNLLLQQYLVQVGTFLLATTAALLVGKSVLVAHRLPFLKRFDTAPLILPVLFKTVVFWACVSVARLLEHLIRFMIHTGGIAGFGRDLLEQFSWHRFMAIQIWILVLFLIYVTGSELNTLFGDGELAKLFFRRASTQVKRVRRERIRTLVQLSALTARHSVDELAERATPAHQRLVSLVTELARKTA